MGDAEDYDFATGPTPPTETLMADNLPLPKTEKHDPRAYLDRAARAMAEAEGPYSTPAIPKSVEDHDRITAAAQIREMALIQEAQVWASMATAAAMLMPTPDEVIATYEETRGEVLGEVQADLITRVERAKRILGDAQRDGSRRHPALHAALAALEGEE